MIIAAPKTEKKYSTKIEDTEKIEIFMAGVKELRVERITITYEKKRELHHITNKPLDVVSKKEINKKVEEQFKCLLREVTSEELSEYRTKRIPSFVYKEQGKLYYSEVPDDINFIHIENLNEHQCAVKNHECRRLSAASDENGGCEKVRNGAKYIEKYPWITRGYETFNTKLNAFVVLECSHYQQSEPRKPNSIAYLKKIK